MGHGPRWPGRKLLRSFLELLGKDALSIMVTLLINVESETAGGHLVITWDKCLDQPCLKPSTF